MISSWLRQLFDNRFKGFSRRSRRWTTRLDVEELESRTVPTIVIWTGNHVPLDSPFWSDPGNWKNGVVPQNFDDVVFPNTVAPGNKISPSSASESAEVPTEDFSPFNSVNDIGNLTLNTLTIGDKNFVIGGNQITLKQQLLGSSTFSDGLSWINFDIRLLGNPQSFEVDGSNASLLLSGSLSEAAGTAGLIKQGPGTIILSNDITDFGDAATEDESIPDDPKVFESTNNSFTGLVEVSAGTLEILSPMSLGTNAQGTTVRKGATLRISGTTVTSEALELVGDGLGGVGALEGGPGRFLVDGEEGVDLSIQNDWQNSHAATWSGPITLSPSASIGVIDGDGDGGTPPTIPPVEVTLTTDGGISGGGDLTKVGGGTLIFPKDNTYAGKTFVNGGTLSVLADNGLSEGSSTIVGVNSTLDFEGQLTVDEPITLNGNGDFDFNGNVVGALTSTGGANTNVTLTGAVTLATPSTIGGDEFSTLTISGPLTGTGDLTKIGLATLILPNSNLGFTGNAIINQGILIIEDPLALGPVSAGVITVHNPGSLQLQGSFTIGKTLNLNGLGKNSSGALRVIGGSSSIDTWAGPITVGSSTSIFVDPASQLTISGIISGGGSATLEKDGAGILILASANTYTGPTALREGTTIITNTRSLGGVNGFGTTVAAGATLQMGGSLNLPADEDVTLTGSGVNNVGALHVTDGNNSINGLVNLSKTPPVLVTTDGTAQMTFSNIVSGSAPLEKAGTGTLTLSGTQSNTGTGGAIVDAGTLLLAKSAGIQALAGAIFVGDGLGGRDADVLRLLQPNQIADSSNVNVVKSGLFDLNNKNETINALILTGGHVLTGSATLTLGDNVTTNTANGQSSVIDGNLSLGGATRTFTIAQDQANIDDLIVNAVISSGTNSGAGIIKDGPGTMRLNAVNSYTGTTSVANGTLKLGITNGIVTSSILSIASGGTYDLNGFNQTVAELSGAGTLKLGTGNFTEGDATSTTFSGILSDSGTFVKIGNSTLLLTGDSTGSFTGSIDLQTGTLQVDGKLGSGTVTVESGTSLSGKGSVGGITDKGGMVTPGSPGSSPGKLTSVGSVSFDSNSSYVVQINGITAGVTFDQLIVGLTGGPPATATLGGAKLLTSFGYNAVVGDSYVLLHTTGGVSGTFSDANGNTLHNLDTFVDNGRVYQIQYTSTDVKITMVAFVSTVSLSSNINPSVIGQAVTFTATIGAPAPGAPNRGGTVIFFDGSTQLSGKINVTSNQAQFTTSSLLGGTRAINATYSGDNNFQGSSGVLNPPQVVNRIDSTTTLSADVNPANYGATYTLTATVGASSGSGPVPTGDVTFVDTSTGVTLGVRTLDPSGKAKLTVDGSSVAFLDAGLHSVKASFPGDTNYNPSSGSFTETVNQVSTSTSVTNDHLGGSVYGEPVTYTATVTSSTITPFGSVTFTADDGLGDVVNMGSKSLDSSGKAALVFNAIPVGTFTVTAAFTANVDFKGSSGTTSESVSQGTTSATLSTSKSPTVFGEPVTFTATITANAPSTLDPAGSVTFVDTTTGATLGTTNLMPGAANSGTSKATLIVSSLSSATGGMSHDIQASYNTDGNYATSSATTTQTVNPAPTVTTVTPSPSPSVYGQVVTITATINPSPSIAVPTGSVVFTIDNTQTGPVSVDSSGKATTTMVFTTLGAHTISAAYTSNNLNNFLSSSSSQVTQQVNAAPTQVIVSSPHSTTQLGVSVTFTATVSAPSSTLTPTGSVVFLIDGSTVTGSLPIDGNGQATFSTSSLSPGPHFVVAQFTTNTTNFLSSTSASYRQVARKDYYATGTDVGSLTVVSVYDATTGALLANLLPYGGFTIGAHVAVGDVNGDGFSDIVVAPASGIAPILIFSGQDLSLIGAFFAYGPLNTGGVNVAVGDVNGDGRGEIITGTGGIAPLVNVMGQDGSMMASFFPFPASFSSSVRVAAGDVDGDGRAEIVTGMGSNFGLVQVFSLSKGQLAAFLTVAPVVAGGVNVAVGDVDGDGHADIITGLGGIAPLVEVFSGATFQPQQLFLAAVASPSGGVRVGAVDRNGDGRADILEAPTGAPPLVLIQDALSQAYLDAFFAFGAPTGGTFVGGSS
jgi:autotransporter-associated beta strand protein